MLLFTSKMLKLGRIGVLSSQLYKSGFIVQDKFGTCNVDKFLIGKTVE